MGGYTNISNRKIPVRTQVHFLGLTVMAALTLSAAPSLADSPDALAETYEVAAVPNPDSRSVDAQSVSSTSHAAVTTTSPTTGRTLTTQLIPTAITFRPLTRAAAQLRIDEMSPVGWLSQFGNVSIGQRD
jgi:hypothetical protein